MITEKGKETKMVQLTVEGAGLEEGERTTESEMVCRLA